MEKDNQAQRIVGSFEKIGFPVLGISNILAKIDTGAYSGALHATNIRETLSARGLPELAFCPLGIELNETRTSNFRKKWVKSSNGSREVRYTIRTKVKVRGEEMPITITLTDRSSMRAEVLIGRRFLRRHGFLVDVRRGRHYAQKVKEKTT